MALFCRIFVTKASIANMNSKDEQESPCLTPLFTSMEFVIQPLFFINNEANEASATAPPPPPHLGGLHQNFNAVLNVDFFIA